MKIIRNIDSSYSTMTLKIKTALNAVFKVFLIPVFTKTTLKPMMQNET